MSTEEKIRVVEALFDQDSLPDLDREILDNFFKLVDFDAERLEADIYLNKLSHWPKGKVGYRYVESLSERILDLRVLGEDNSVHPLFSSVSYSQQDNKLSLSVIEVLSLKDYFS